MPPPPMIGKLNLSQISSGGGWGLGEVYSVIPPAAEQAGKATFKIGATDVQHESDEESDARESARSAEAKGSTGETAKPPLAGHPSPPAPARETRHGNPKLTRSNCSDADTIVDHGSDADVDAAAAAAAATAAAANRNVEGQSRDNRHEGFGGGEGNTRVVAAAAWAPPSGASPMAALKLPPLPVREPVASQQVDWANRTTPERLDTHSDASGVWAPGEAVSCTALSGPVRSMAVEGKELWVAVGNRDVVSYTLSGCSLSPSRTIPNVNNVTSLCVVPAMPRQRSTGFRNDRSDSRILPAGAKAGNAGRPVPAPATQDSSMLWCGLENGKIKVCNLFFATVDTLLEGHHSRVHFMFLAPGPRGTHRVWSCSDSVNKSFTIWDATQCKQVFRDSLAAAICDATVVPPQLPGQRDATIWTCSHFDPHYKVFDLEGKVLRISTKFQGMGIRAIRYHASSRSVWMCIEHQVVIVNASTFAVMSRVSVTSPVLEFTNDHALLVAHGGDLQESGEHVVGISTDDPLKPRIAFVGAQVPSVSVAGLRCISPVLQLFVAAHTMGDNQRFFSVLTTCETPVMDNWGVGESAVLQPPRTTKQVEGGRSTENGAATKLHQGSSAAVSGNGSGDTQGEKSGLLNRYLQHVPEADLIDSERALRSAGSSQGTRITHHTDELSHHAVDSATRNIRVVPQSVTHALRSQTPAGEPGRKIPARAEQSVHQQPLRPANGRDGPQEYAGVVPPLHQPLQQQQQQQQRATPTQHVVVDNTQVLQQLEDMQRGFKQLLVSRPSHDDFGQLYSLAQRIAAAGTAPAATGDDRSSGLTDLSLAQLSEQESVDVLEKFNTPEGKAVATVITQLVKTLHGTRRQQPSERRDSSGMLLTTVASAGSGSPGAFQSVKSFGADLSSSGFTGADATVSASTVCGGGGASANTAAAEGLPAKSSTAASGPLTPEAIVKLLQQQSRITADERFMHHKELNAMKAQHEQLRERFEVLRQGVTRLGDDFRRQITDLQRSGQCDPAALGVTIRDAGSMRDITRHCTSQAIATECALLRKVASELFACMSSPPAQCAQPLGGSVLNPLLASTSEHPVTASPSGTSAAQAETGEVTPRVSARSTNGPRSARGLSTTSSIPSGALPRASSFAVASSRAGGAGSILSHRRTHSSGFNTRSIHGMKVSERRMLLSVIVAPRIARIEQFADQTSRDLEKMNKDRDVSHRIKVKKLQEMSVGDEAKMVTLRRLEAEDFSYSTIVKDLDLVFQLLLLCEHESLSVICGTILNEMIEVLRFELEQNQNLQQGGAQQNQTSQLQIGTVGAGQSPDAAAASGALGALMSSPHDRGAATPLHDLTASTRSSLLGVQHSSSAAAGAGGAPGAGASAGSMVNSPIAQLLSESEAIDQRFSEAAAELESLASRVRAEVTALIVHPVPSARSGPGSDACEQGELSSSEAHLFSTIPRLVRPNVAKFSGLLYWSAIWLHLLVGGITSAEVALQSPNLSPNSEAGIRMYLAGWSEGLLTIRRLVAEVKESVLKLERASADRQSSPLLASPLPTTHHARDVSFTSAGGVSFAEGSDGSEHGGRDTGRGLGGGSSPSTGAVAGGGSGVYQTSVAAVVLYFTIASRGDARALSTPGHLPALLDATPSRSTSLRRDGVSVTGSSSQSAPTFAPLLGRSGQSHQQKHEAADRSAVDLFSDIADAIGEIEVKLPRLEHSVEKLLKSIDLYPLAEQRSKRSAELAPHMQKLCRINFDAT